MTIPIATKSRCFAISKLTKRQREILRKFQIGYVAWAANGYAIAHLVPGPNVVNGNQEVIRISSLDALVEAGILEEYGEYLHDINWRFKKVKNEA